MLAKYHSLEGSQEFSRLKSLGLGELREEASAGKLGKLGSLEEVVVA
jgi:hypothetical protein